MKRKFFMLALAGFVAFSFVGTSCGDDDEDDNTTPVVKPDDQKKDEEKKDDKPADNTDKPAENTKNHFIVVDVPEQESQDWDSQFWIVLPEGVADGDDITISFKCKADVATVDADGNPINFGLQWHNEPSDYQGNMGQTVAHTFTTEWTTVELTDVVSLPDGKTYKSITWNLNNFDGENKYYFDDISVKVGATEKITNGNIEGTDFKCFAKKTLGVDANPVTVTADNVKEE